MKDLNRALVERRSVRNYSDKEVEEAKLLEVAKSGLYAPSGRNTQLRHFTVLTNKEILTSLNKIIGKTLKKDNDYNFYYNAPALIIVSCPPQNNFPKEDAACSLMNIFLAAYGLGLGSCWINQLCGEICSKKEIRQLLDRAGVPSQDMVYGCASIGYCSVEPEKVSRDVDLIKFCR